MWSPTPMPAAGTARSEDQVLVMPLPSLRFR